MFCFAAVTTLASTRGNLAVSGFYYSRQRDELKSNDQSSDGWTFCFEDKCRCKDDLADCSHNCLGDLAFIPRPLQPERVSEIRQLLLSSTVSVGKVSDHFFTNVTNITSLDMSDNDLVLIGPNAFRSLSEKPDAAFHRQQSWAKLCHTRPRVLSFNAAGAGRWWKSWPFSD